MLKIVVYIYSSNQGLLHPSFKCLVFAIVAHRAKGISNSSNTANCLTKQEARAQMWSIDERTERMKISCYCSFKVENIKL
jgi:hypothetical protein